MRAIPYRKDLLLKAKQLRKKSTLAEVLIWQRLKSKQLGFDFNRQKPLLNYIVDFYCLKLGLAIEIDGESHDFKGEYDEVRQEALENLGIKFLRFREKEVRTNLDGVVQKIRNYITKHPLKSRST